MLKNLSEKLGAKFPVICCGYFMVKMAHLGYAFSEFFKPGASQVKCQSFLVFELLTSETIYSQFPEYLSHIIRYILILEQNFLRFSLEKSGMI